ncbi:MAG: RloB domain-containing protein [Betaproteobacteria bacterium]|nr:RloB domain-containing protein [Betaproteobacteria bacterium]
MVTHARNRFEQVPRDRVFVLIDAEQDDLLKALKLCELPVQRESKKKGLPEIRIEPVVCDPCFEFWLLLHFRYCDQPFASFADVLPELQAHLPDYEKNDPRIFVRVGGEQGMERALSNVTQLRKVLAQTGASIPATDMDKLIEVLRGLTT